MLTAKHDRERLRKARECGFFIGMKKSARTAAKPRKASSLGASVFTDGRETLISEPEGCQESVLIWG